MSGRIRLSGVIQEATTSLSLLDAEALEQHVERLNAVLSDKLGLEPEPVEAIRSSQRMLSAVLRATAENLRVLERVEARRKRTAWER